MVPRAESSAFDYVKKLRPHEVQELMMKADLGGLSDVLIHGIEELRSQRVGSASALNDKFSSSAKFQMSYGSLSLFYGGLESLLGPPQMHKDPEDEDEQHNRDTEKYCSQDRTMVARRWKIHICRTTQGGAQNEKRKRRG